MKIYTYWSPVPELNMLDEFKLLLLWRENWAKAGFEPVVLNEYVARQHPYFEEFDAVVSQFPTVNPPAYERSCLIRHLAMAQIGGGILSDFDVINKSQKPPKTLFDKFCFYQVGANGVKVPCLTSGSAEQYLDVCKRFAAYQIQEDDKECGRPHLSDQGMFQKLIAETPDKFTSCSVVVGYGEPGWEKATCIHCSNGNMTNAGKTPKYVHVPTLL